MRKLLYILLFCSVGLSAQDIIKVNGSSVFKVRGQVIAGINPPSNPSATISVVQNGNEVGPIDVVFRLTLSSAAPSGGITVNYTTPLTGTATSGTDYTAPSGSITVPEGNTTADITIAVTNDALVETTETVILTLTAGSGYDLGSPLTDTATISSEDSAGGDPLVTLVATDAIGTEGVSDSFNFRVSASEVVSGDKTVNIRWNGLYTDGSDCPSLPTTVIIADGTSYTDITRQPSTDGNIESEETVFGTLEAGSGYQLGNDIHAFSVIVSSEVDNLPSVSGTSTITNAADFSNAANAGTTATVTGTFTPTGPAAAGMRLVPGGGLIMGTGIDLNGSGIVDNGQQLFSSTATFSSVYTLSRLSPEIFGAVSGDATDDNTSIDALVNNCQYGTATLNGAYIKNNDSYYTRSGEFDWNMNGAKVSVTSAAGFPTGTVSTGGVFEFTNVSPRIYNGEFDGTDTYGRLFYLHGQDHYMFNNLYIHNLFSTTTYRCVVARYTINADGSGFNWGEWRDNNIDYIYAAGDGDYNNSPAGISKWLWYTMSGHSTATVYDNLYVNNTVNDIIGDDAEAWYAIQGSGTYDHKGSWTFINNGFSNCTRRATKACVSNVAMYDNTFTELVDALFNSAQQMGSMCDFFSTFSTDSQNFRLIRNTLQTATGAQQHYNILSFTDARDIIVRENIFDIKGGGNNYGTVRLGSNTATYDGALTNFEFSGNTLYDATISVMDNYAATIGSPLQIFQNDFYYDSGNPYNVAPLWWYGSSTGSKGYIDFDNNNITYNVNPIAQSGLIRSTSTNINIPGFNSDGCTINFVSTDPTFEVGYIVGSMSSSSITNLTITNGSGTPILRIDGTEGITNGPGNSPSVTIQ